MDLESKALLQFDRLVARGELLWKDEHPRHVPSAPFHFEFRVAHSLMKKPLDFEKPKKPVAFADDNEDFDLGTFGSRHKLILNKFSVVRPQFVLHTVKYESQNEPLNVLDFQAIWHILQAVGKKYMAIYNCGAAAGASVNHKHIQIIPRSPYVGLDAMLSRTEAGQGPSEIEGLPFLAAFQRISSRPDGETLESIYLNLREKLRVAQVISHNVILHDEYMIVIPRTKAWIGEAAANAAAMMGIVWCMSEDQHNAWLKLGPMQALVQFGVPLYEDRG